MNEGTINSMWQFCERESYIPFSFLFMCFTQGIELFFEHRNWGKFVTQCSGVNRGSTMYITEGCVFSTSTLSEEAFPKLVTFQRFKVF